MDAHRRHLARYDLGQSDGCPEPDGSGQEHGCAGSNCRPDNQDARPVLTGARRPRARPHEAQPVMAEGLSRAGGNADHNRDYDHREHGPAQDVRRPVRTATRPTLPAQKQRTYSGKVRMDGGGFGGAKTGGSSVTCPRDPRCGSLFPPGPHLS